MSTRFRRNDVLAAFAVLLLLAAGPAPAFDPYDASKGYCGPSGKSLPAWLEPHFNYACYKHDECYNQCANTGTTKSSCDNQFLFDMKKACANAKTMTPLQRGQCFDAAAVHFEAVRTGASYFPSYNCTAADLELAKTPELTLKVDGGPGPVNVAQGGRVTLNWEAKRVSDCAAYGGWTGAKSPGPATQQMGPLESNKIYTLMCRNSSGNSVTKSVEVRVGTAGGGTGTGTTGGTAPSVELKLNGRTGTVPIGAGQPAVLAWSSRNTAYCQASQDWSGNKSADGGTQSVGPITSTRTYTLTCNNTAGVGATQSVIARLTDPEVQLRINGGTKPVTVPAGGSATLTWSSSYATSCTASGGWSGNKSVSGGTESVGPIRTTTMYTLYCRNSLGDNAGTSVTAKVDAGTTGSGTGSGSGSGSGGGTGAGTGTGGTGSGTTTTTKPALDLRINGIAGTINVASGAHVTVTWSAQNVVACKASSGWTGDKPVSGSQGFGPITARRQFVLACRNAKGGYVTKSVAVIVGQTGR